MTWQTAVLVLAALLALAALILALVAWRLAGGSAARRRLAGDELLRLHARRRELDRELVRQPMLAALFDDFEDLRCRDRVTPIALQAFARMHLGLFQAATELIDRLGDDREPATSNAVAAWDAYIRRTLGGSRIMRDVLARSGDEYGYGLSRALRRSREPVGGPTDVGAEESR